MNYTPKRTKRVRPNSKAKLAGLAQRLKQRLKSK